MSYRRATSMLILLFAAGAIVFGFLYGPAKRVYAHPSKVVSAASGADILRLWESEAVRGRLTVCFSRHLNAEESMNSGDVKFIEQALNRGITRTVFHVLPDRIWEEISEGLSKWPVMRTVPGGLAAVFENGRVYIFPLSAFSPPKEKALVVLEPGVWTREEFGRILGFFRTGQMSSDLLAIIRGSEEDRETFSAVSKDSR